MSKEKWYNQREELTLLLNLTQAKGTGAMRIKYLIARFGKPSAIFSASIQALARVAQVDTIIASEIKKIEHCKFGIDQLNKCESSGVKIITLWNGQYPDLLKKIDDAPIILYIKGQLPANNTVALAIVGTRSPSTYGKQVAEKLATGLVQEGFATVSGFARGIDTVVHSETVKRGGHTIAVLGCGLDIIYPPENKTLAEKIISNGALISEFPFGAKPDAMNFPRRNRIISGLALGTVVVEARNKSGALITANFALEQNREVFAIPGSIYSPLSAGPHQLIKEGAKLVSTIEDVFEEIPIQGELFHRQEYKIVDTEKLSPQEIKALQCLSNDPVHIDQLASKTNLPTSELLALLLQLEFNGYVKQTPGKMFIRL
ncbi:MAG: DNA-processing protein DprA [bacterium]